MKIDGQGGKSRTATRDRDEWGSERLDVGAYLARLDYAGGLGALERTLRAPARTQPAFVEPSSQKPRRDVLDAWADQARRLETLRERVAS